MRWKTSFNYQGPYWYLHPSPQINIQIKPKERSLKEKCYLVRKAEWISVEQKTRSLQGLSHLQGPFQGRGSKFAFVKLSLLFPKSPSLIIHTLKLHRFRIHPSKQGEIEVTYLITYYCYFITFYDIQICNLVVLFWLFMSVFTFFLFALGNSIDFPLISSSHIFRQK